MPMVHYVTKETPLPGGEKMIRGLAQGDSSYSGTGETLNLANYLKSSAFPTVVCSSADGYAVEHSQGNAEAGTLIFYHNVLNSSTSNGVAQNTALYQVQGAKDLSAVNVVFVAIGQAY